MDRTRLKCVCLLCLEQWDAVRGQMRLIAPRYVTCHPTTVHQYVTRWSDSSALTESVYRERSSFTVRDERQQHNALMSPHTPVCVCVCVCVCVVRSIRELLRICAEKEKVSYSLKVKLLSYKDPTSSRINLSFWDFLNKNIKYKKYNYVSDLKQWWNVTKYIYSELYLQ